MFKLLIITVVYGWYNCQGSTSGVASSIAEYPSSNAADSAYDKLRLNGEVNGCSITVIKMY